MARAHGGLLAVLVLAWIPVPPPAALAQEESGPEIYYKEGIHVDSSDGANTLHLQGRVQGRFTWDGLEEKKDASTFAIQRGKIKIVGNVLSKSLKYGFQMNLATKDKASTSKVCTAFEDTDGDGEPDECTTVSVVTKESTSGIATLEDYYVDYVHSGLWGIKTGQYKVPFLMQELTSSGKQQFVDRSLATGAFNFGRDIGLDLHGGLLDGKLKYDLFLMNGDGTNSFNRNSGYMAGGRLHLPILGLYEMSESDLNDSDEPNLGAGLAYAFNQASSDLQGKTIPAGTKASHGTLDLGFKQKGFSLQAALMATFAHEGEKAGNWGYLAQAGYFLVPKRLEVALRTSGVSFEGDAPDPNEYAVALNYFVKKHNVKLQTDYSLLDDARGEDLQDHRVQTQVQVVF